MSVSCARDIGTCRLVPGLGRVGLREDGLDVEAAGERIAAVHQIGCVVVDFPEELFPSHCDGAEVMLLMGIVVGCRV